MSAGVLRVSYFHRRPLPAVSYSIETYFETVRRFLPPDIQPSVSVSRFYSRGVWPRLFDTVRAALRQGDVNHVTGDIQFVALLLRGNRTLVTVHDCAYLGNPSRLRRRLLSLLWYRLPLSRVAAITAVSDFTRSQLLDQIPELSKQVRVVPTCVSPTFHPFPREFNTQRPTILHVGTSPNKNLDRLAAALQGIPCTLHIVGRLSDGQIQVLRRNGIDYRSTSSLDADELVRAYADADVVAFCSTFEGFGMPIVEAQIVGRPVVTSNVASMPEVAGGAACLVDPFDVASIRTGIERVIGDATYRADLVRRGSLNALRFEPTHIAETYAEIYRQIATGRGASVA